MKTALIIGGGVAGCAMADQFRRLGEWDVTLVERANFLGAGNRTHFIGGHPHTFGPRHFLTGDEEVYSYLDSIVPLRLCAEHEFVTYVEKDATFYNFPIHEDDIRYMPERQQIEQEISDAPGPSDATNLEEYWIKSVGATLYSKFVDTYSKKMWQIEDNRLLDTFKWSPKGTPLKSGPRAAWDSAISAYPVEPDGYNRFFDVATQDCKLLLGTTIEAFDIPSKSVHMAGNWHSYDVIVNSISPDVLFDFEFGELPYIGRDIHFVVLPVEFALPQNVYFSYYAGTEPFTRVVEYKKFTQHRAPDTLISLELPSGNGRHYPLPVTAEQARAQRYFDQMPQDVFSIGRAGSYRYDVDIDDSIRQAMNIAAALT